MLLHTSLKRVFLLACLLALVFTLLMFPVTRLSAQAYAPTYQVKLSTDIAYGPYPDEVLDQCTPINAPTSRPGLIMIHGGSWRKGDKSQYDELCSDYATEGFVVTTINYRLAPVSQWPDQIGDAQLAVRYMRANAALTKMNPAQICSFGDSSGSQLALLLDELRTIHHADVANIYPRISPTVQCVVDQFGATDLTQLYNEDAQDQQAISDLLDYQTPPSPLYQDASPVYQVVPQAGQALIIQGTKDHTVLPDQSQELQKVFRDANIPVQYIAYDGGHEYEGLSQDQINAILAQVNTFLLSIEQP